ncbi:MAG: Cna B-type domain-containing protein, partial [Candidatus Faecivicinus sp.]
MRTKKLLAIVLTLLLLLSNIGLSAIAQDQGEGEPVATTVEPTMEFKTEEPAADEPAADEPAADEPADDEPADDGSADDGSADDESSDDESSDDEPADDEPADDGSADDESTDDGSADDESTDDESTDDETAADESKADESKEAVTYTVTFFDVDGQVIDARNVEEDTVLELSAFPSVEEDAVWFLVDEDGDLIGEEPVEKDLTIVEDTYLAAVVLASEVVAFANGSDFQSSSKTSVDHIDIACQGLKATVGGETVSFSFGVSDVNSGKVNVTVNGTPYKASGTSTDSAGHAQVRISGTFPVGTISSPQYYTIAITTMLQNSAGVTANVTLSIYTNYWSNDNVCPGLEKNYRTTGVVGSNSGIDIELAATEITYTQLNIKKVLDGITFAEDKTYSFTISGNGTTRNVSVTIAASTEEATVMVPGLPEGTYTVVEDATGTAVEGYTLNTTYSDSSVNVGLDGVSSVTVTNKYTPSTIEISGTKTWVDADDQDGKRPEEITVKLLADGQVVKTQTVTADGNGEWKYAFTAPMYDADGSEIVYTVEEEAVEDYTATYAEESYDITNT